MTDVPGTRAPNLHGESPQSALPMHCVTPALVEATGDPSWLDGTAEQISGGKSNLTFRLVNGGETLILRRPPTGELLPSAHDMAREVRVQSALAGTQVPVPRIVLEDDGDLIGVPFYVMEEVPGHAIREALPDGYATTPAAKVAMTNTFVDTLALLHALDPEPLGLEGFGYPSGFMARQVRRWTEQWQRSKTHEVAEIDALASRLASAQPPLHAGSAIVHGDYRLDNVMVDSADPGRLNAVLDWELSTLGDPRADVGLLLLYWRGPDDRPLSLIPGVTHLAGFPTRDEVLDRYAHTSGADVSDVDYFLAFAHFKFAVIAQGVAGRFESGAMGNQVLNDLKDEIRYLGALGLDFI